MADQGWGTTQTGVQRFALTLISAAVLLHCGSTDAVPATSTLSVAAGAHPNPDALELRVLAREEVAPLPELPGERPCDVVHLTPDGTRFEAGKEASIVLRCVALAASDAGLKLMYLEDLEDPSWEEVNTPMACNGELCTFSVSHFSLYTVVGLEETPPPEAPSCDDLSCGAADACCPAGCDAKRDVDCSPVCGNGVREGRERCDGADCPTAASDCVSLNTCSVGRLAGDASVCSARCVFDPVSLCVGGDGCCPSGCNANSDSDCAPVCGNDVREAGESCDGASCVADVASCDDGDQCTTHELVGGAERCSAACVSIQITDCGVADGCCASGCHALSDPDCSPLCGNGVREVPETCDGVDCSLIDCDDGNACTADGTTGSAESCSLACVNSPVTQCISDDGCCAAGCSSLDDNDCAPVCGNGLTESGEQCDGDCPTDCDDGDSCTVDGLVGSAAQCEARCEHVEVPRCGIGTDIDLDGDRYAPDDGDCDDTTRAVYPGAAEAVDGRDNDCDGFVDEATVCADLLDCAEGQLCDAHTRSCVRPDSALVFSFDGQDEVALGRVGAAYGGFVSESHPVFRSGVFDVRNGNAFVSLAQDYGVQSHAISLYGLTVHDISSRAFESAAWRGKRAVLPMPERELLLLTAYLGPGGSWAARSFLSPSPVEPRAHFDEKGSRLTPTGAIEAAAEAAGIGGGQGYLPSSLEYIYADFSIIAPWRNRCFDATCAPDTFFNPPSSTRAVASTLSPSMLFAHLTEGLPIASVRGRFQGTAFDLRDPQGRRIAVLPDGTVINDVPGARIWSSLVQRQATLGIGLPSDSGTCFDPVAADESPVFELYVPERLAGSYELRLARIAGNAWAAVGTEEHGVLTYNDADPCGVWTDAMAMTLEEPSAD